MGFRVSRVYGTLEGFVGLAQRAEISLDYGIDRAFILCYIGSSRAIRGRIWGIYLKFYGTPITLYLWNT